MKRRVRLLFVMGWSLVVAFLLIFAASLVRTYFSMNESDWMSPQFLISPRDERAKPERKETVQVFFSSSDGKALIPEKREVLHTGDIAKKAKSIIELLITGPENEKLSRTLPREASLPKCYFLSDGRLVIDFTSEIRSFHPGGTQGEWFMIRSVVESIFRNLPEVVAVKFLVDGSEVDTIAGHIDVRHYFTRRESG